MSGIWMVGLAIGIVLMLVAYKGLAGAGGRKGRQAAYKARAALLTEPEQVLLHRLREAFPEHLVFSQVAMNQIVSVHPRIANKSERKSLWNRINGLSLDFVVCSLDCAPVAAIELDDRTHERADRRKSDANKDAALESAGVRLLRISVGAIPSADELQERLARNPQ